MSFAGFAKPSDFVGGSVFKSADHMKDVLVAFEPKSIAKDVTTEYQGQRRVRDEVTADITTFATAEALTNGEPTTIQKGIRVVHGMITSSLERNMGGAMVAVVRKVPTQKGSGYALRDVENPEHVTQALAYFEKREAEKAAALADAPGFD